MTGRSETQANESATASEKFLTFALGQEEYGLEILKVREIIQMMELTVVPRTPPCIKGVINLRGKVIPVVDLRLKFDLPEIEHTEQTCIIVVTVQDVEMGVIVDRVCEVRDISAQQIDDAPSFGANVDTDFVLGLGKTGSTVTILLDIDKVLTGRDLLAVPEAGEPAVSAH